MKRIKLFAVAVSMLAFTACQNKDAGDIPVPTSKVEPASQNEMMQAPELSGESVADNSESVAVSEQWREQALQGAQVLTEHLINRVFHKGIVERGEEITDRELFYFFTTLPGYMQNQDHPYHDAVALTPESLYIFPEGTVRQVSHELFGVEEWAFNDGVMEYNPNAGQYESSLQFGTGANQYICSEIQAVYLEDVQVIAVSIELEGAASIDGDPGWEYLGKYMVRYQVVQENGMFLRYIDTQKA